MGLEATCEARTPAGRGQGKLLLETDELLFRGPPRVKLPLKAISKVSVRGGTLTVVGPDGPVHFELGAEASRWALRLTNPRTRVDKLAIKPGHAVSIVSLPDDGLVEELTRAGAVVTRGRVRAGSNVVLVGVERMADLGRLETLKEKLDPSGGIWVVHRKGPSGVKDVEIFAAAKAVGLVANKVMRFSETHSAERLVIPKAMRGER